MEYMIVGADSPKKLTDSVNELCKKGWMPTGGISTAMHGAGTIWYYQAVIKGM